MARGRMVNCGHLRFTTGCLVCERRPWNSDPRAVALRTFEESLARLVSVVDGLKLTRESEVRVAEARRRLAVDLRDLREELGL